MAINISINEIPYHRNIVLNFSLAVSLRLAKAEPMVVRIIAVSMNEICIKPKNKVSIFTVASLKFVQKYLIIGLWVYNIIPIVS